MNILPETEKKSLRDGLKSRFVVVTLIFGACVFVLGIGALVPAYVLTKDVLEIEQESLAKVEVPSQDLLELPTELGEKLLVYEKAVAQTSFITIVSQIVEEKPASVSVTAISFLRDKEIDSRRGTHISVSGIATSRSSLAAFESALSASNNFTSVTLPVSSLTRDKDLPFTLDIFIKQ